MKYPEPNSNTVISAAFVGLLALGLVAIAVKAYTSTEDYCRARKVAVIQEVTGRTTTFVDDTGKQHKIANRSIRVGGMACTRVAD